MKKKYTTPLVEKITFDYKMQTNSASSCYESVINQMTAQYACDPSVSTPMPIGWTEAQTGV